MNRIDCEEARENIDAYVIGALDVEERRALEAHLSGCPACSAAADAAREAAMAVALWAPLVAAGPALKARVMASAAVLTDLRHSRNMRWWATAAAAVAVVSASIVAWNAALHVQIDGLEDRNSDLAAAATAQAGQVSGLESQLVSARAASASQDAMLNVMSQPDVQLAKMSGTAMAPDASGRYVWSPSERLGAFDGTDLPPLPDGHTYRFWFIYESEWENVGVVDVDGEGHGRLVVQRAEGASAPARGRPIGFAVTVEPAFGADQRSGAMVLRTPQE